LVDPRRAPAQIVREEAQAAGVAVSDAELQAADAFRRDAGLTSAADTHAWLAGRGLSVDDFEADLGGPLLAATTSCCTSWVRAASWSATRRGGS
jgi:hypothetical protein